MAFPSILASLLLFGLSSLSFANNDPWIRFVCLDGSGFASHVQICDGKNNCLDGSDEVFCESKTEVCPEDYVRCPNHVQCVLAIKVCNGVTDCNPSENNVVQDEDPLFCARECPKSEGTYCAETNQCLPKEKFCNWFKDCPSGIDEDSCESKECPSKMWKCANGIQCAPYDKFCDGKYNACIMDNSDEDLHRCTDLIYDCPEGTFECVDMRYGGRRCYYPEDVCDGLISCRDVSDEENCGNRVCPKNRRKCSDNTQCIPPEYLNDGDPYDCRDVSDEFGNPLFRCGQDFFMCANESMCIPQMRRCNGVKNCSDNSDELDCPPCPNSPPSWDTCVSTCQNKKMGFFGEYNVKERCDYSCKCKKCPAFSLTSCKKKCRQQGLVGNFRFNENGCKECECQNQSSN